MRWDAIAQINESPTVKSLGFWFLILPIAARLLQADALEPWLRGVRLPFTWGLLYAAAFFFFLSRVLYVVRCPAIIKKHASWADFAHRDASFERLIPLLAEVLFALRLTSRQELLGRMKALRQLSLKDESGGELSNQRIAEALSAKPSIATMLRRSVPDRAMLADIYSATREAVQFSRPLSRTAIVAVQLIGAALLLWVATESAVWVIDYYF